MTWNVCKAILCKYEVLDKKIASRHKSSAIIDV